MENKIIETVMLPLSQIHTNDGQIEGLPANPRILIGDKFDYLCNSIKNNPEMLGMRELLVYEQDGEYITIGGNMRLQAMRYLRYEQAPCKIIPQGTSIEQLRAYVIKDNVNYGEWNDEELANDWSDVEGLEEWGATIKEQEDEEDKTEKEDEKTLTFLLSSEQFKYVKQRLNEIDKNDNGNALMIMIEDYEREQEA